MGKTGKICISAVLILGLLSPFSIFAAGLGQSGPEPLIGEVAEVLLNLAPAPGIGQVGGDWAVIALARSGIPLPDSYIREYHFRVIEQLTAAGGVLSSVKYSEYSRVAIAAAAIGADPADIGGYDMLAPLRDYDATVYQGINGPIFALIALYAAGCAADAVAERYIEYILSFQLEDGGFALSGTVSDPDTTAMSLAALSGYVRSGDALRLDVAAAIDRGVERLGRLQRGTGGFTSFLSTNSESVSQAIIALCGLGISLDDERFVKNGNSLIDNLLTYYIEGEGFEHELGGGVDLMATEQALCALAAVWRLSTGQTGFYDMSDVKALELEPPGSGLPGKHPDINVPDGYSAVEIFSGIGGDGEDPVSRSGFIAALIRSLGLRDRESLQRFSDVTAGHRFFDDVGAAFAYGIVTGRNADIFDPDSYMTREEAATAVYRVSKLCGLGAGVVFDETAVRNILSQFIDYRGVSQWAAEAMAFCYYYGILDDVDIEIRPSEKILMTDAVEILDITLAKARLV